MLNVEQIKEFQEEKINLGQESILNMFKKEFKDRLNTKNIEIINEALKEKNAGSWHETLISEKIESYLKRLRGKYVYSENSVRDLILPSCVLLFRRVQKVNELGGWEKVNPSKAEEYREDIIKQIDFLNRYLSLLLTNNNFNEAELNSDLGFLGARKDQPEIKGKSIEIIRKNQNEFLNICESLLNEEKINS